MCKMCLHVHISTVQMQFIVDYVCCTCSVTFVNARARSLIKNQRASSKAVKIVHMNNVFFFFLFIHSLQKPTHEVLVCNTIYLPCKFLHFPAVCGDVYSQSVRWSCQLINFNVIRNSICAYCAPPQWLCVCGMAKDTELAEFRLLSAICQIIHICI